MLAETEKDLQNTTENVQKVGEKYGIKINITKKNISYEDWNRGGWRKYCLERSETGTVGIFQICTLVVLKQEMATVLKMLKAELP